MYGITSKTAIFAGLTALALGIAAPAAAGDRHHGGHDAYGKHSRSDHGRYGHRYWHKHGHHGVAVHAWRPARHRPPYQARRIHAACHPVIGHGRDHFGRKAKFGATMCYDRYGRGYVVAGSRHVIRYF